MDRAEFCIRLLGRQQIISVNGDVEALLGIATSRFLAGDVTLKERIHTQDADVAARLFDAEKEGTSATDDAVWESLRVRHADGRIRCVRAMARRVRDGDGVDLLLLTLEDARHPGTGWPEDAVPAPLRVLLESSEDPVYFKDRHHVLSAINEKVKLGLEHLELGHRDVLGLTDYDIFPEEHADTFYAAEKEVLAGKPMAHVQYRCILRNGAEVWLDHRTFPVKDKTGAVVSLLGRTRTLTDAAQAEVAQRESAELLREAQRIAGIGSYVFDVSSGRWTASEALDEVLGTDSEYPHTVEGWLALIHPEDRTELAEYLHALIAGHAVRFDRHYRIVRPRDGATRWVQGRGELERDEQGHVLRMRGTIQDVTEHRLADTKVRESREMLRLFIEHAPAALAMFDREMRYLACSRRWLEMFEINPVNLAGRTHYEVLPNIPEEWRQAHQRALAGEVMPMRADRLVLPDARVLLIRREVHPWWTGTGEVGGVILFAEDITQQKLAEERLQLAASVFTHAAEGILITDAEGTILDVNDAFTQITGYEREEVVGKNPRLLRSMRHGREFYEEMWRHLLQHGKWTGEIWNKSKSGRLYAEMLTISAVPDETGKTQQYVAMFSDLTSTKEQEWKLERMAHYDLLTGLPNRVLLAQRQRQAMEEAAGSGRVTALICLDLDDFKGVNERFGHNVGDQFLMAAANRLKGALRPGDTLARPSGDEFFVVLPNLQSSQDVLPILAMLQGVVREPFEVGPHKLKLSASAGVACYPQPVDVDGDQLLRQASQAMYHAKLEGKDRYHFFDPRQDENVRGHHEDVERIHTALLGGELELHYQPRVNMRTGKLEGAEALIRWQHPEAGLLQPAQFLPVIEGSPLEIEVGEWVMETAMRQLDAWHRAGLDLAVSVNVSAQQLQSGKCDAVLRKLLAAHPTVPANKLELEILENGALTEMAAAVEQIETCRKMGVTFALDDFGTGYSSLSYLRRLPIEVLKIDRTFVRDMLDDPEDLTLLEGVLGLASAFRRLAVAEGVESVEHGLMLLRLGCEQGQGYGIARPMPADEMTAWARAWRPHPKWVQARSLSAADWPLLHAIVEHRAWVAGVGEFVMDGRKSPPALAPEECQLGRWLANPKQADGGGTWDLSVVERLHTRVHGMAVKVVELKESGRQQAAQTELDNLQALRDQMLAALERLVE